MGLSTGLISNPTLPGLKLKAWAFFTQDGTVIKAEGVSIVRTAPGSYTATFTTATNTSYVGFARISDQTFAASVDSVTPGSCRVVNIRPTDQTQGDRGNVHVAFYE